ncbi:hypothetical protein GCM10009037_25620 [Halarchaeum grantii]|uniref:Uncharacterized protein n=1 Tax=Halarchaeum grantii TaxID=1193105 RepID=A0A830FCS9_9EURY|nr:hypothetical protein [Halarchaeum grantii]GGL40763.1 hypothetical protein GCM10009037_25620 [Halarchaeum grantii]
MERAFEVGELDAIAGEGGDGVDETATAIAREAMFLGRVWVLAERALHTDWVGDEFVRTP